MGGYEDGDKSNAKELYVEKGKDDKENTTHFTEDSELQNDKNKVNDNMYYDCSTTNAGQVAEQETAIPCSTIVSA